MTTSSELITFEVSISTGAALTVALKHPDGSDPSGGDPIILPVGGELLTVSAPLSVTITPAMGDIFAWDGRKIQGYDAQLFVYLVNNNGTPEIGVSPCPILTTVAACFRDDVGQTGSVVQSNIVMSGTRDAANVCAVIGRVNVLQLDNNNWQGAVVSKVIPYPIYKTDWLRWLPTYTGFSTPPSTPLMYKIDKEDLKIETAPMGILGMVSSSSAFSFTLPYSVAAMIGARRARCDVLDNGAFLVAPGSCKITPSFPDIMTIYKAAPDDAGGAATWTTSGAKSCFANLTVQIW